MGFAGTGVMLAPSFVPSLVRPVHDVLEHKTFAHAAAISRVSLAALLAVILAVVQPETTAVACAAVAGAMLLSGALLRHHRRALLGAGGILALGGLLAMYQLEVHIPQWVGRFTLLGAGEGALAGAQEPLGLWVLGVSTGWVGLAAVCGGMLAALIWSLRASRDAAPGCQARAALWACVVALSSTALLAGGGMSTPAVMLATATTFALMPHLVAHRVASFRGWSVAVAFTAVLLVLGLEQHFGGKMWLDLALQYGDETMHLLAGMVLTVVLFWQSRSSKFWQALLCCLVAAALASLGESDVVADVGGAAAALGVFLMIRLAAWVEITVTHRPTKISYDKYRNYGTY